MMDNSMRDLLMESLEYLHTCVGKNITIDDALSSNGKNFNRHFTRFSHYNFLLEHFMVRMSGAVATLEGESVRFEFKTDQVAHVEYEKGKVLYEIKLAESVWRRLAIEVR